MGSLLLLLRHEQRLWWRGWLAGSKRQWVTIAVIAGMALGLIGLSGLVALGLQHLSPPHELLVLGLVGIGLCLVFSLMTSAALTGTIEAVHFRGDLDLLLTSPLAGGIVLAARLIRLVVTGALGFAVLALPLALWLVGFGQPQWMALPLTIFGLGLCAAAAGLVIALVLFGLLGPQRARQIGQVTSAVIGASVFLIFQINNFASRQQEADTLNRLEVAIATYAPPLGSPFWAPVEAALGAWEPAVAVVGVGLIAVILAGALFCQQFTAVAARLSGQPSRRQTAPQAQRLKLVTRLGPALRRKEWRLLFRDPNLTSRALMQVLYLLPLGILVFRNDINPDFWRNFAPALGATIVLFAASIAGALTWLTVSAEDNLDLIRSAPTARVRLDQAKVAAGVLPAVLLAAIPLVGLVLANPQAGLAAMCGVVLAGVSAGCVGVWYPSPGDRKTFKRVRKPPFSASIGSGMIVSAWASATALAGAGMWLVALIPVFIAVGLLAALNEGRTDHALDEERQAGLSADDRGQNDRPLAKAPGRWWPLRPRAPDSSLPPTPAVG
jgi:ABC-2 type transport system permease protein